MADLTLFGLNALPDQRRPFAPSKVAPMPNKGKRENWAKPLEIKTRVERPDGTVDLLPGRTIESKDGARAKCKPSRGYVEGALSPKRGHAMGGPTAPGNWTTLASGHDQRGTPYTMTDYVGAERRAYAKAHVKGPSTTRRVLNANLDAEPTTEFRQPGGPGQVGR